MSDLKPGDRVRVIDGPFASFEATVERVDAESRELSLGVTLLGRAVPIRTEPWQVEPLPGRTSAG
jgi:transcriptional antiterminator NusG